MKAEGRNSERYYLIFAIFSADTSPAFRNSSLVVTISLHVLTNQVDAEFFSTNDGYGKFLVH